MTDINLLPQELEPSHKVIKLASKLKSLTFLSVIALLIFVALYFSAYFFLNHQIENSLSNQNKLKNEIKALEQTEQRLVLIKDRLDKINSVNKNPKANDEVERLNLLSDYFSDNIQIGEISLDENQLAVKVTSDNLENVANYLASVISSGKYVRIRLSYLNFDPKAGYGVGLVFPE